MIPLALAMIRRRAAGAATTFLLATVAIAGAVAPTVYLRAAAASVAEADYAVASPGDRLITASTRTRVQAEEGDAEGRAELEAHRQRAFDRRVTAAMTAPDFHTVFTALYPVALGNSPADFAKIGPEQQLEFRQDYCRHVQLTIGRCPAGPGEVVVGPLTAEKYRLRPGGTVHVQAMMPITAPPPESGPPVWVPEGMGELSVVGVYRAGPDADPYWTGSYPPLGGPSEPLLTDRATLATIRHEREVQGVVAYPVVPGARGLVRADITRLMNRVSATGASAVTGTLNLLDRIEADRRRATLMPSVAAVPLVLLCCFVLYLAAANTAQARRLEFGMLKLRGSTAPDRVWFGSAEILVPLILGGFAGYFAGHVGVWLFGRATLGGPVELSLTTDAVPPAAVALTAAMVVCLLALRRNLVAPVADLLRRVPNRTSRRTGLALRMVAVALAVAALVQLRTAPGVSDVSVLAPALAILAVGLIGAMAFDTAAARWGGRALRRGRLGLALGLLHLGRRRSGARLLALLAVAIGLVAFAAAAAETSNQARRDQVAMSIGAEKVVVVRPVAMRTLLHTVRTIDPGGDYAMAVMALQGVRTKVPVLVVDSTRLARVGASRTDVDLAAAAPGLRPRTGPSIEVRGDGLELRARLSVPRDVATRLTLSAILAPLDGSHPMSSAFGDLRPGLHTYRADVDCPTGCRLEHIAVGLTLDSFAGNVDPSNLTVTLTSLRQTGPDVALADAADLAGWADHHGAPLDVKPEADGVSLVLRSDFNNGLVGPADIPNTLPGLGAGPDVVVLTLPAPRVPVVTASVMRSAPALPRLGALGGVVDMEYVARMDEPGVTSAGEVWLAADAPADTVERLRSAGLTIAAVRDRSAEFASAADRPNAVGVRFFLLVGVLCLLLAAGGLALAGRVEIDYRAEELSALRAQGLARRVVRRAGRLSYLMVVGAGAVLGVLAGLVAWVTTRDRLPLVDELITGLRTPAWPGQVTLWTLGASVAGLAAVAVLLAAALSFRTRRGARRRVAGSQGDEP